MTTTTTTDNKVQDVLNNLIEINTPLMNQQTEHEKFYLSKLFISTGILFLIAFFNHNILSEMILFSGACSIFIQPKLEVLAILRQVEINEQVVALGKDIQENTWQKIMLYITWIPFILFFFGTLALLS